MMDIETLLNADIDYLLMRELDPRIAAVCDEIGMTGDLDADYERLVDAEDWRPLATLLGTLEIVSMERRADAELDAAELCATCEAADAPEHIDTRELAAVMGCTERNARRLAPLLGGTLEGRTWRVPAKSIQGFEDLLRAYQDAHRCPTCGASTPDGHR